MEVWIAISFLCVLCGQEGSRLHKGKGLSLRAFGGGQRWEWGCSLLIFALVVAERKKTQICNWLIFQIAGVVDKRAGGYVHLSRSCSAGKKEKRKKKSPVIQMESVFFLLEQAILFLFSMFLHFYVQQLLFALSNF